MKIKELEEIKEIENDIKNKKKEIKQIREEETIKMKKTIEIKTTKIKKEIIKKQKELYDLNEKYKDIIEYKKAIIGIPKYEKMYPSACEWSIENLVLINETFEEWFERVGKRVKGFQDKTYDMMRMEEFYEKGGIKVGAEYVYLKYLLITHDKRIINTKVYDLINDGAHLVCGGISF